MVDNLVGRGQTESVAQSFIQAETTRAEDETNVTQDDTAMETLKTLLQEATDKFQKKTAAKNLKERAPGIKEAQTVTKSQKTTPELAKKADEFQQRNPELLAKMLLLLRDRLEDSTTPEDVLTELEDFYPDPALADQALEFLEQTTTDPLKSNVIAARALHKAKFHPETDFGRSIGPGKGEKLGAAERTELRDFYKSRVHDSPIEPTALSQELSTRFPTYEKKQEAVKFLYHQLGEEMKKPGASIEGPLLVRLCAEARSLQAVMGVDHFFKGKMPLIEKMLNKQGLDLPPQVTFEVISKAFINVVRNRYPTVENIINEINKLIQIQ